MTCQGMDLFQTPHRDAELLRHLHFHRAGPMPILATPIPLQAGWIDGVGDSIELARWNDSNLHDHGQFLRQRSTIFARQIDVHKDRVGPQLGAKTQARLTLRSRAHYLDLTDLVEQFLQVPGSQGLVFDDNGSDPDPHENKS